MVGTVGVVVEAGTVDAVGDGADVVTRAGVGERVCLGVTVETLGTLVVGVLDLMTEGIWTVGVVLGIGGSF